MMAISSGNRRLLHTKSRKPIITRGIPDNKFGSEGDVAYVDIGGIGLLHYVKYNNAWVQVIGEGGQAAVTTAETIKNVKES